MASHTQRKWFDRVEDAADTKHWFDHPAFEVHMFKAETWLVVEGDGAWLYLKHTGPRVDNSFILLPNYEMVQD